MKIIIIFLLNVFFLSISFSDSEPLIKNKVITLPDFTVSQKEYDANLINDYLKISGDNNAFINNNINLLLLIISFAAVVATFLGVLMVRKNTSLHNAYMDLHGEIKDKIKYSIDLAVAQESVKQSDSLYVYSQAKLDDIQTTLVQSLISIESITSQTKKIIDDCVHPLDIHEEKEIRRTFLDLLSENEIKIDNSLMILEKKINSREWLFLNELLSECIDNIVLNNLILKKQKFRYRIEEINKLLPIYIPSDQ